MSTLFELFSLFTHVPLLTKFPLTALFTQTQATLTTPTSTAGCQSPQGESGSSPQNLYSSGKQNLDHICGVSHLSLCIFRQFFCVSLYGLNEWTNNVVYSCYSTICTATGSERWLELHVFRAQLDSGDIPYTESDHLPLCLLLISINIFHWQLIHQHWLYLVLSLSVKLHNFNWNKNNQLWSCSCSINTFLLQGHQDLCLPKCIFISVNQCSAVQSCNALFCTLLSSLNYKAQAF